MNGKFECRYCLSDENPDQLVDPCKCEGSMRYVHQKCLEGWIVNGNRYITSNIEGNIKVYLLKCEICKYQMKYQIKYQNGILKSLLETVKLIFGSWTRITKLGLHLLILYLLNKRITLFIKECMNLLNHPFCSESAMELIHNLTIFVSIVFALREFNNYYLNLFGKMRKSSMIFMKRLKDQL